MTQDPAPRQDHRDPHTYAKAAGRRYLTPEDIDEAIRAGAVAEELQPIVLRAMSAGFVEDWRTCAFIASKAPSCSACRDTGRSPVDGGPCGCWCHNAEKCS